MKRTIATLLAGVFLSAAGPTVVRAEAPPDEATLKLGQRVFMMCRSCHTTEKDARPKIGPNLHGVFGSKAGSKPDFKYSDAVKSAGVVWTDKTIDQWLKSPRDFIPGNKMSYRGIDDDAERKAVIDYLKQETTN